MEPTHTTTINDQQPAIESKLHDNGQVSRAEPLADGGHDAGKKALDVLNVVKLRRPSVLPVNYDYLPVRLV